MADIVAELLAAIGVNSDHTLVSAAIAGIVGYQVFKVVKDRLTK